MSNTHRFHMRVYYEDTDAGGVVYYANYLKFAERARTEMLRELGISQSELAEKSGLLFVVHEVNTTLHKPARLDDMLEIKTTLTDIKGASLHMQQSIICNDNRLSDIAVTVVCVNQEFKPTRMPKEIISAFEG